MKTTKTLIFTGILITPFLFLSCFGPHHHDFHCSSRSVDRILDRIDDKVEDLDLNTDQERAYSQIREKVRADLLKANEHRRDGFTIVEEGLTKDNPDIPALVAQMKTHMGSRPNMMVSQLDHFQEFYAILNTEQQKKVIKEAKDKMDFFACDDR